MSDQATIRQIVLQVLAEVGGKTVLDLATASSIDGSTYAPVHRPVGGEAEKATLAALVNAGGSEAAAALAVPRADATARLLAAWLGSGAASSSVFLRGDRTWAPAAVTVREQDGSPSVLATILEAGDRLAVVDGGGGIGRLGLRSPWQILDLIDDFVVGTVTSGSIGNMGWSGSASSFVLQASTAAHPGILRISTSAVANNIARLHGGPGATDAVLNVGATELVVWSVRIPTITTMRVRLGLGADLSASTGGASFVGFEFDSSASANWRTVTRSSSTETATATSTAVVANNWYLLIAKRLSSGNWEFYINDSASPATTHSTNLPSGGLAWGLVMETLAASARTIDLDFAMWRSGALARFT